MTAAALSTSQRAVKATSSAVLLAALVCATPQSAQALDVPNFSKGGFVIGIEFGPGVWAWDAARLESQITNPQRRGDGTAWAGTFPTSYALGLRLGYNILGHATVEFAFAGSGWALSDPTRGGGGFAAGVVRWHPLQLMWTLLKKDPRPFGLDFSTYWGWGYGIAGYGVGVNGTAALGMDGFAFEWGFDVEYWLGRSFGLALGLRGAFPFWNELYYNFDGRQGSPLPQGSGGAFWHPSLGILLRFGD